MKIICKCSSQHSPLYSVEALPNFRFFVCLVVRWILVVLPTVYYSLSKPIRQNCALKRMRFFWDFQPQCIKNSFTFQDILQQEKAIFIRWNIELSIILVNDWISKRVVLLKSSAAFCHRTPKLGSKLLSNLSEWSIFCAERSRVRENDVVRESSSLKKVWTFSHLWNGSFLSFFWCSESELPVKPVNLLLPSKQFFTVDRAASLLMSTGVYPITESRVCMWELGNWMERVESSFLLLAAVSTLEIHRLYISMEQKQRAATRRHQLRQASGAA